MEGLFDTPTVDNRGDLKHCAAQLQIELLTKADIRQITPFMAQLYASEFNYIWKKDKNLVLQYFNTHKGELSLWVMRKLNKIVYCLIQDLNQLKGPAYASLPLDAGTAQSLKALENKISLMQKNGDLERFYTTSPRDILEGRQLGVLNSISEVGLAKSLIDHEYREWVSDERFDNDWLNRKRMKGAIDGTLRFTCFDTICDVLTKAVFGRQCQCKVAVNYQDIGMLLDILYKLRAPSRHSYLYLINPEQSVYDLARTCGYAEQAADAVNWYNRLTTEEALVLPCLDEVSYHVYEKTHEKILNRAQENELAYKYLFLTTQMCIQAHQND